MGDLDPSNTWFLGPTRVLNHDGISIDSAAFAGLITVTDRQTNRTTDRPTDHATRSVTIGRIYVKGRGADVVIIGGKVEVAFQKVVGYDVDTAVEKDTGNKSKAYEETIRHKLFYYLL